MVETATHARLVARILDWVAETHRDRDLCSYSDVSSDDPQSMPPRIYGFVPDVFARTLEDDLVIVGEAKRSSDWEVRRTRDQLAAFLRFLEGKRGAMLVVATEWSRIATAESVVSLLVRERGASRVRTVYLSEHKDHPCQLTVEQ